jgi:hypothetical protein
MCKDAYTRTTTAIYPLIEASAEPLIQKSYAEILRCSGSTWMRMVARLLISGVTREWLLANIFQNLACLILASIIVALAARQFISSAETFSENSLRATVIPYKFVRRTTLVRHFPIRRISQRSRHAFVVCHGINRGCRILLVVIPYGLLCQYVMKRVSNTDAA